MAPHSGTLAWKIPRMEEPGRLQSMGSLRVGRDWVTSFSLLNFHALEKEMATHSSVLAQRIPGTGSLVGCCLWGCTESDTTEQLHFHFSVSSIGEGNGNPLQCSCLENPRDGEPGGLPSLGMHRVRHDWSDLAAAAESEGSASRLNSLARAEERGFWSRE